VTKAEEYRHGARVILEIYRKLPNGPERKALWKREQELLKMARAEEGKVIQSE
jgi:hypothetical protein